MDGGLLEVQRRVQKLLAYVALRRHTPRDVVAGQLWPECREARAHGNLRSTLWRANRLQGELISEHSDGLSIAPGVTVDIERLVAAAHCVLDNGLDRHIERTGRPAELFAHDLLPGWYDDWVLVERERLRQLQLHALESLARALADACRYSEAVDVAMEAIAAEPVRESAHRIVIDVHLAEGNVGEARRAFDSLRRLLAVELGIEPSTDLASRVRMPQAV